MQSKIQASEHSAKVREAQTLEIQILTTENTQLRQRIEQLEAQLETLRGENEKHGLVLAAEKQQADDIHSQNEIKRK
jgi:ABC-type phosphate transport system auxiliary subunit